MTFQSLFEVRAATSADRPAVLDDRGGLTYGELNAGANRLARHLRTLGVGPETLVAVCLPRSVDLAVAILAIVKTGGAWLPLDPAHPHARLALMLGDARASVLLTQGSLKKGLGDSVDVVDIDADRDSIARQPGANLDSTAHPANLAYVIYTSGSTGTPKGVMLTHAALTNYMGALQGALNLKGDDVFLHTASIAFSSSVRQLLAPLSCGAQVVIASSAQVRDPVALFDLIRRKNVTILDLVPSYWRTCFHVLVNFPTDRRERFLRNRVRLILSASEPLFADLPRRWRAETGCLAETINMYGQTETTGTVSACPAEAGGDGSNVVPIGRPLHGTRTCLLDDLSRPVATGEVGDIHVAGPSLARGYLNDPALTAERFNPDGVTGDYGARLYKTGDLGRCLQDGSIGFVGRVDQQVKVRGHRVELAEVEATLVAHPAIRQAVVVVREDAGGDCTLAAYAVRNPDVFASAHSLAAFVAEQLPDYMVPATFIFVDELPLTPTGKVDRRALLRAPEETAMGAREDARACTNTEQKLCSLWCELLHRDHVGVDDDFFRLGGQSLFGMQMLSRLSGLFGVELSWEELFETPTVAGLAERIEALVAEKTARFPAV